MTGGEPVVESEVELAGQQYPALGLVQHTHFGYQLSTGRWFDAADSTASPTPVLLGPAVARTLGAYVRQLVTVGTLAGPSQARVVGIATVNFELGTNVCFPLAQLQRLTNSRGAEDALWVTTSGQSHAFIDRVAADAKGRLWTAGFPAAIGKVYVNPAQNVQSNDDIIDIREVLGLLVVGINLIGLVSTLTMAVIERSREVGVLCCLGASARQVRRVFSAEALAMAVVGWVIGSAAGWLLYRGLVAFIEHDFNVTTPEHFSPVSLPVSLLVIVAVTVVVIRCRHPSAAAAGDEDQAGRRAPLRVGRATSASPPPRPALSRHVHDGDKSRRANP